MNYKDLKEKYPLSCKALEEYNSELYIAEGEGITTLTSLQVEWTPRALYNFFDSQNIILSVDKNSDNNWEYDIVAGIILKSGNSLSSRVEAEDKGFTTCFKILNQKLSKIESNAEGTKSIV